MDIEMTFESETVPCCRPVSSSSNVFEEKRLCSDANVLFIFWHHTSLSSLIHTGAGQLVRMMQDVRVALHQYHSKARNVTSKMLPTFTPS